MTSDPGPTMAARLAEIHTRLDVPPGVMLGILRLPILDGITRELEVLVAAAPDPTAALDSTLVAEIERMADLLAGPLIGGAAEAQGRRVRLVELLRRADRGRLPPRAFDVGDPFGAEAAAMLATDEGLRLTLGRLYPLAARATAVVPSSRWLADARAALPPDDPATRDAAAAVRRLLSALVRADIVSRPDLLVGGLRLINQRVARGLLWLAPVVVDRPAQILSAVGLRMGTSGRTDAVVRDTALANTCAALLGASSDPAAATVLASMRVRVTNRNVLRQVARALDAVAARAGVAVESVIELALPDFDLDAHRRRELSAGDATARIELLESGRARVTWRLADGAELAAPPASASSAAPDAVATVAALAAEIDSAVAEERRRMEERLASERAWPAAAWRARFIDHPVGGLFGRRLVWTIALEGRLDALLPAGEGWLGIDGRPRTLDEGDAVVRLWHPADAPTADIVAWQGLLAARGIEQPVQQVARQVFRPLERDLDLAADRRVAGRIVDHGRLRALLRQRGWAAPFVGTWDQGDEATAWRVFDDSLRAELLYQAVERLATGERHERVRLVAVHFVRAPDAAPAAPAAGAAAVRLVELPRRVFSEAIRDVSLVVAVGAEPGT